VRVLGMNLAFVSLRTAGLRIRTRQKTGRALEIFKTLLMSTRCGWSETTQPRSGRLRCAGVFLFIAFATSAQAQFQAIDIFVDSKEPLAAYQLEFSAGKKKQLRIVGIEGGEHSAFTNAPYYDPKAMQRERVVLGAFSTAKDLPKGRTRVATIHVQVVDNAVEYRLKLHTAANAEGQEISVHTSFRERKSE
jgi:hypothetical protein